MGIQSSILSDEKIKQILENEYGIVALKIEKIDRGTANIFKIYTQRKN